MNGRLCAISSIGQRAGTAQLPTLLDWRIVALWRIALATLFLVPVARSEEAKALWQYRGFTVDASRVASAENLAALRAATEEQIEIVCEVGLSPKVLAFVRTLPLRLVTATADTSPGAYNSDGHRIVDLATNLPAFVHHGVLLHELMHAFHDQCMTDGFDNRDVAGFFEKAKAGKAFPEDAYMLQDPREFFACAGNVFLYGVSGKEPFTRARLQERDPELFAYLGRLFGPAAGRFPGSLATGPAPPAPESKHAAEGPIAPRP